MLERQEEEDLKKLDSDNKINENLLNNLNKGWFSNRSENLLGSEEIFMNIKKEIEVIKKRNEDFHLKKESTKTMNNNDNINIFESDLLNKNKIIFEEEKNNKLNTENNNEIQEFNLNDRNDGKIIFEYSAVNYLAKEKKQFEFNKNWKNFDKNFPLLYEIRDTKQGYEYIELNKMVLRLVKEIDYDEYGLELNLKVNLLGQSQLLIFTRCFVNKDLNESDLFEESRNVEIGDIFNKYTSLIKIIKEKVSNRCYITFGTYYNDPLQNNKLCHKFFLKRQLIDYSDSKKDDICEFNIIINDFGEETIDTRIYINDNEKPNDISGNFFMPINKKAKILMFGMGTSVRLKDISGKIFNKRNESIKNLIKFESENSAPKNCECCNII
jgi:hypothetical protein